MTATCMDRRRFLQLSAGLVALLTIPPAARLAGGHALPELSAPDWQHLFSRPESACAIGQVYLQAHAQEADAAWLLQQIAQDMAGGDAGFGYARIDDLKTLLRGQIQQDFADEKVVKLNSWILARTEARLCALAALARTAHIPSVGAVTDAAVHGEIR